MTGTLTRINALTSNARNTWFALLGVLVFVGVTLMGVKHIDFYGVNRATQLPLVNVAVPTELFFYAAPLLTAAVYIYFHLYLIRLFDELGHAPGRLEGDRLGQAITPWLVSDAALWWRQWFRQDGCREHRPLEFLSMLFNVLLAWGFGLLILWFSWWQSMPARNVAMTGINGISLIGAAMTGLVSFDRMVSQMRNRDLRLFSWVLHFIGAWVVLPLGALAICALTYARTMGPIAWLAPVNLAGEHLVEKPAGWQPHDIARKDFRAVWCKREGLSCADLTEEQEADFKDEWQRRRSQQIADLTKPDFKRRLTPVNLRDAEMTGAFLVGVDLSGALMEGASLSKAQMEEAKLIGAEMQEAEFTRAEMQGADLREAKMQEADLSGAEMQEATLIEAKMQGANLRWAEMQGADLRWAEMQGANLSAAEMQEADLWAAKMQGADLSEAEMQGAKLIGAEMQGAKLIGAEMQGAKLNWAKLIGAEMQGAEMQGAEMQGAEMQGAEMQGSQFHYSLLTGQADDQISLSNTNLTASINNGGAVRFVNMRGATFDSKTDFRNAFLDGSVTLPDGFAEQMACGRSEAECAAKRPCHWPSETLSDEQFYGTWRTWVERDPISFALEWTDIAPAEWRDVKPQPIPDDCQWVDHPMPEQD